MLLDDLEHTLDTLEDLQVTTGARKALSKLDRVLCAQIRTKSAELQKLVDRLIDRLSSDEEAVRKIRDRPRLFLTITHRWRSPNGAVIALDNKGNLRQRLPCGDWQIVLTDCTPSKAEMYVLDQGQGFQRVGNVAMPILFETRNAKEASA